MYKKYLLHQTDGRMRIFTLIILEKLFVLLSMVEYMTVYLLSLNTLKLNQFSH